MDVLATRVLGYEVKPLHLALLIHQMQHAESLSLAFRGAGKSTVCTIAFAVYLLCLNRNIRILLASKSLANAQGFLKEIKGHLEANVTLIETFGPFFDARKVEKWDNTEIEVLGRTKRRKEASITCVGNGSTIVSKHYDVILGDDLVDEDNSRTEHMRAKTHTWYYQTLLPTLEPPDPDVPHRGDLHLLGTRYHYGDLYGHLLVNEMKKRALIIRALDEHGRSPWPQKYPRRWFEKKRATHGTIIFGAQYLCSTEAMKGEIFEYDHCQQIDPAEYPDPKDLKVYMGVDLAIKECEKADQFAIVVVGCLGRAHRNRDPIKVYLLDFYAGHLRFSAQTEKILQFYDKWNPVDSGIESVAYQLAQYQSLKDKRPDGRFYPQPVSEDKVSRAWKLSALSEALKLFFKRGKHGPVIDQLVTLPSGKRWDLFDALDIAVRAFKRRKRRKRKPRKREPGLL